MANISASYEEMRNQARQLRTTRDTINQSLTTARQQVDNLVSSGFVTDSASGAFQASYHEFTTSATRTIDSLDAISRNLEKIVSTLEETDRSLGQQMKREDRVWAPRGGGGGGPGRHPAPALILPRS